MLIITQECANRPALHAVGEAKEGLAVLLAEYGASPLVSALGDLLCEEVGSEWTASRFREEVAEAEDRDIEPDPYEPPKKKSRFCAPSPWTGEKLRVAT